MYPGKGTVVLIRPAQTFYERIMSWHDLIGLVEFDVTELSPGEGPEAGAFTAAKLVQKVIGYSVPAA